MAFNKFFFGIIHNYMFCEGTQSQNNSGRPSLTYNEKRYDARIIEIANLANNNDLELLILAATYKSR